MNKLTKQNLIEWNEKYDNYQKLQHVYLVLLVTLVFAAGVSSLFSLDYKSDMVKLLKLLVGVLVTNFVVMTATKSFVVDKINSAAKKTSKKVQKKK